MSNTKVIAEREDIVAIADAIRSKTGETGGITLGDMPISIDGITTEAVLQSKTVSPTTSSQTVTADSGYDGLSDVTVNAMPTATQATPSISVSSAGKITATSTQSAGYVAAGTKTATKTLTTQAAKTVTPTTSEQTAVASGVYTTGAVKVAGDANLVAGNIKSGTSIFGVTGSYEGSGGVELPTLSTPATASEIFKDKEAIDQDGNKVTGTFTIDEELTAQEALITELEDILATKADSSGSGGDSGSGGSVETCIVTFATDGPLAPGSGTGAICYTGNDLLFHQESYSSGDGDVFQVVKNSLIYITGWSSMSTAIGATQLYYNSFNAVFCIEDDAVLTYMG